MRISQVPGWWLGLTTVQSDLLDLLAAVERAGVAKNDKTMVDRIWQDRRIARARMRLVQEITMRERLERDDAA